MLRPRSCEIGLSSRWRTIQVRTFPAVLDADSTCVMVAGARFEPLQMNFEPPERFIAGRQGLRFVA